MEQDFAQRVRDIYSRTYATSSTTFVDNFTKALSEEFILIRKSELPPLEMKQRFSLSRGETVTVPTAGTATYHGIKDPKYYWDRVKSLIAMAQYADDCRKAEERDRHIQRQNEAWKMLAPDSNWDYTVLPPHQKRQADVVVGLLNELDELKAKQ